VARDHRGDGIVKTAWRVLRGLLWSLGALALALSLLLLVARHALQPAPGVWATRIHLGPVAVQVGVPSLLWLATTPWIGPWLNDRVVPTRLGAVRLHWQSDSQMLVLDCTPCQLSSRGWGDQPLTVAAAQLSVRRHDLQLEGELSAGRVRARWRGTLTPTELTMDVSLTSTPIRDLYALAAIAIPEVAHARIEGEFSLDAKVSLPSGPVSLAPRVQGFAVQGLGTAALMGARSRCDLSGKSPMLGVNSHLARAVIAAEDQRFFSHTGFDVIELNAAFQRNLNANQIERGGSTLSQQLARLLLTGGERSPTRKLRELLYAVEMEQTLGKAQILGLYLDHAPWGQGLCGAEAAAQHYFGVPASRLSAAQSVWMAAMLHNPQAEAAAWSKTGRINLVRAQWVAAGVRPLSSRRIAALVSELGRVDWAAPTERAP
jgi:hypothetical protein